MTAERIVLALGGNAFSKPDEPLTMAGQFRFAHRLFRNLAALFASPAQILMTHGNGPQVGHLLTRVEEALGKAYAVPLEVCVAESEGELGYVLQQSIFNVLQEVGAVRPIVGLLTQVVVDESDSAFSHPSKPIGPFLSDEQAETMQTRGYVVIDDAGRGWRRCVPSPQPQRVVEAETIAQLLEMGVIVVAAGGGGIPVVERDGRLVGVEAVVDKDLTSALLGDAIDADVLLILTGVPYAYQDFNTPRQSAIGPITPPALQRLAKEGHFAPGSMLPKVEAAIKFASRPGRRAIICNPETALAALRGEVGTIVETAG